MKTKKVILKNKNGMNEDSPKLNQIDLEKAINHVDDLFDRALCPFMFAGETGKTMREGQIAGNKIEVVVNSKDFEGRTEELFKTMINEMFPKLNIDRQNGFMKWEFEGVPIEVRIAHRKYPCLLNSDMIFYKYDTFKIPNPWAEYWPIRGLIR